jgi:hypothetical protein
MNVTFKRFAALALLGIFIALMGCQTLGIKAPPGQVKKVTGQQSASGKK